MAEEMELYPLELAPEQLAECQRIAEAAVDKLNDFPRRKWYDIFARVQDEQEAREYVAAKVQTYLLEERYAGRFTHTIDPRVEIVMSRSDETGWKLESLTCSSRGEPDLWKDASAPATGIYGQVDTDDAIASACHYNCLVKDFCHMVDREPEKKGIGLSRPEDIEWSDQHEFLWMLLVLKFGDYGTSPRSGWITDIDDARTYVHALMYPYAITYRDQGRDDPQLDSPNDDMPSETVEPKLAPFVPFHSLKFSGNPLKDTIRRWFLGITPYGVIPAGFPDTPYLQLWKKANDESLTTEERIAALKAMDGVPHTRAELLYTLEEASGLLENLAGQDIVIPSTHEIPDSPMDVEKVANALGIPVELLTGCP